MEDKKMKKHVFILVMTLCCTHLMAQTEKGSTVFNVAKPSTVIAVSPLKMAVLYIGVDNPVEIAISDMPMKYITATVDSGEIEDQGGGQFVVRITKNIKVTKVNVFETYNGITTKLGERLFRVKKVPDPIPTIAGSTGGLVSKPMLAAAGGLIPVMKDFDFELFFTITSFTFSMNVKGDLIEKVAVGNKLTADMIKLINAAPKGTKIYIEDIKATGPDGMTRTLSSLILKII
jgi:gliding motility-associated protein GldM